ncbi:hypothetical protein KY336_03560 [Candidatus Woesearchaeota archaeon]|nr:hypothetical protein [Candidatus Woesearchaeota archaeon]
MKLYYFLVLVLCLVLISGCLVTEDVEEQQEIKEQDIVQETQESEKIVLPPPEPEIVEIKEPEPVVEEQQVVEIVEEPEPVVEVIEDEVEEEIEEYEEEDVEETGLELYTRAKGGSPTMILLGRSALKPHLMNTMYSNEVFDSRGEFRMAVVDTTDRDSDISGDRIEDVFIEFRSPEGFQYYIQEIRTAKKGITHTNFGGVGLNKYIYGDTGIESELNPKTLAYITVWGETDLYKNGHFFAANVPVHVAVIQGIRHDTNRTLSKTADTDNVEAHLLIPGQYGAEKYVIDGLPEGFLHVYFEDVGLFKE